MRACTGARSEDRQGAGSATLGSEGNLIVTINGRAAWQSGTAGHPGAFVRIQDEGAVSIVPVDGVVTSMR